MFRNEKLTARPPAHTHGMRGERQRSKCGKEDRIGRQVGGSTGEGKQRERGR